MLGTLIYEAVKLEREGEEWLEQILNVHTPHPFSSVSPPIFLFVAFQLSCKKNYSYVQKYLGGYLSPSSQVVYDDDNNKNDDDNDYDNNNEQNFSLNLVASENFSVISGV